MALMSNSVNVGGSAVALHAAGPAQIRIKNNGLSAVLIGPSGAGAQKYLLESDEVLPLVIGVTEVVFGISADPSATNQVVVIGS